MKLMIASDIHGSAAYCRELLEAKNKENVDKLVLLGDILYHGPRNNLPKEYREKAVEFGKSTFGKVLLDVKLKPNAKKTIDKLKEEGHKIVIITARDKTIYDDPFGFTAKQLEKLGIKYDKLVCSFDKRQTCIDEKIEFFVDDCIENLNKVEHSVGKVLLFNSKTNMGEENHFTRVNSWEEIYQYISNYKNNAK